MLKCIFCRFSYAPKRHKNCSWGKCVVGVEGRSRDGFCRDFKVRENFSIHKNKQFAFKIQPAVPPRFNYSIARRIFALTIDFYCITNVWVLCIKRYYRHMFKFMSRVFPALSLLPDNFSCSEHFSTFFSLPSVSHCCSIYGAQSAYCYF